MTDYEQRLELENLVTEAYFSSTKPSPTLPIDDEEVDLDLDEDLDDEPEDDETEDDSENDIAVSVCPVSSPISFPSIECEELGQTKKNFMIISDNLYKLKELAASSSFLDVFEPWMLEKLAVVASELTSVVNSAKFNALDVVD